MSRRRTNGEGTVDRLPSGKHRGRVAVIDRSGTLVRRTVTRATKAEVLEEMRRLKTAADSGRSIRQGPQTVRAFFDYWEATSLPVSVGPATADLYRSMIRTHVLPVLGDRRMISIKPSQVEALVHGLKRSESTCRSVYAALRKMWAAAVRDGVISRDVVAETRRPSLTSRRPEAPGLKDARALLTQVKGTRLEPLVILLATTGARRGELLACKWSDVEVTDEGQFLNLARSLTRTKSDGLRVRALKTNASTRRVPLPSLAVDALRRWRVAQTEERLRAGSAWVDSGFIFTTPVGGACEPRNVSRDYAVLARAAGVEALGMHALRHYVATVMLDAGSSPREVADQLGHASVMVTLDVYAATVPASQRAAVERVAGMLG